MLKALRPAMEICPARSEGNRTESSIVVHCYSRRGVQQEVLIGDINRAGTRNLELGEMTPGLSLQSAKLVRWIIHFFGCPLSPLLASSDRTRWAAFSLETSEMCRIGYGIPDVHDYLFKC